jgi:hypothetical protein
MSSTTDGVGATQAAGIGWTGFPAAFTSTPLVVNSGSIVSAVTGSFADNTPGVTAANTLIVSFQDSAALPSGSTITVVLPAEFTSTVVAASPTVSGTGVTVSGASSFSALTLTVTTASEIAAATSVSLLIPLLALPVGGSYTISVGTSLSPALVATTSPHVQIGGTSTLVLLTVSGNGVSAVPAQAEGILTVTVTMMTTIEIPVGGSISLIARKETAFVAATQVGVDDGNTYCAAEVATGVAVNASTASDNVFDISGNTSFGTTTLMSPTCFISAASVDTVVITAITAVAAIPANTAVTFTYANTSAAAATTGVLALDDSYHLSVTTSVSVLPSAESLKAFNSDAQICYHYPGLSGYDAWSGVQHSFHG